MIINLGPQIIEKPYNQGMQELRGKRSRPLDMHDFMDNIVYSIKKQDEHRLKYFLYTDPFYWDTPDALAYHNATFTIDTNSKDLLNVNSSTELSPNQSLPITLQYYNRLVKKNGLWQRNQDELILDRGLTQKQFREHELWYLLLQKDKKLQEKIPKIVYPYYLSEHNQSRLLGIYLPDDENNPAMRALYLWGLYYSPNVYARNNLDNNARFLTVRTQNLERRAK